MSFIRTSAKPSIFVGIRVSLNSSRIFSRFGVVCIHSVTIDANFSPIGGSVSFGSSPLKSRARITSMLKLHWMLANTISVSLSESPLTPSISSSKSASSSVSSSCSSKSDPGSLTLSACLLCPVASPWSAIYKLQWPL